MVDMPFERFAVRHFHDPLLTHCANAFDAHVGYDVAASRVRRDHARVIDSIETHERADKQMPARCGPGLWSTADWIGDWTGPLVIHIESTIQLAQSLLWIVGAEADEGFGDHRTGLIEAV